MQLYLIISRNLFYKIFTSRVQHNSNSQQFVKLIKIQDYFFKLTRYSIEQAFHLPGSS